MSNNVARWNGSAWSSLGDGAGNGTNGGVYALAVAGSDLYAGGFFDRAGDQPARRVARWNGTSWSSLGSGAGNGTGDTVNAIGVSGSDVYVGGFFSEAGGLTASRVARWNGTSWSALGSGLNESVDAISVLGGDLFVGGTFTQAGGASANHVARWNGSAWSALGSGSSNGVGGSAYALAVISTDLFVGGQFTQAGGGQANNIARWDGSAWMAFGTGAGRGVNGLVRTLAILGGDLYVGGFFTEADGRSANHVARWNGSRWSTLGSGATNGVNGEVWTLATVGTDLYVGGLFTEAGGQPANNIARWNGNAWSSLGTGSANGVNDYVWSLAIGSGGNLYVGGVFTFAGGQPANRVARWNGSAWSTLGIDAANGVNDSVLALAVIGNDVFAGGQFTQAGGQSANHIARWDGSAWRALGTGAGNGVNDWVQALASLNGNLFVGGYFTQAGGQPAGLIASWNGSIWSSLGTGLAGDGNSFPFVAALSVSGSDLYAGGRFVQAGSEPANGLARWNGTSWQGLATDTFRQTVLALISDGVSLYVGGTSLSQAPLPDLQSKSLSGAAANGASRRAVISRNGSRISFASDASDLVAGDGDALSDIFVRDPNSGITTRASAAAEPLNPGVAEAYTDPTLSADGERVAFSGSSGQVYGIRNGLARIISRTAPGTIGNGFSGKAHLAGAAPLAFYESQASNLAPVDGNGTVSDILMTDMNSGTVTLISRGPAGEAANGASYGPWVSDDGQTIVFSTLATNIVPAASAAAATAKGGVLQATMMRGGGFGQTRIYLSRNLASGELGNGNSINVRVTPDGRFGVFESLANNLVPSDSNNASDIFHFEISNNRLTMLERVSTSRLGLQANGASFNASISDDGQFITFETNATNLIELDRNSATDILVKWIVTKELTRPSSTTDGNQPNGASVQPSISGDGNSIVFASGASNLAPGDSNGAQDVFLGRLRGLAPINPSGAWYDPAQDGHGLQFELLAGNRVLAFWYTFDPAGDPAYFIGDGSYDGNNVVLTNLRPVGSFFPPNFNASQISLQPFGSMLVSFESCSSGKVTFDLPQGFGRGSMNLTRLTQPAGVGCDFTPTTSATGPMAGATGAWYNPAQVGQGLVLESLAGGQLLATWYTQGPSPAGGQSWLAGVGTITGNQATLQMLKLDGGRFIPNFNPASIVRRALGSITITLSTCSSGQVSWVFGEGYGSGNMPLQRITMPVGVMCGAQ